MRDVLPNGASFENDDYEDGWNGWEAREVVFPCEGAAKYHSPNYFFVFRFGTGVHRCGATFLFVSMVLVIAGVQWCVVLALISFEFKPQQEKYRYRFVHEQPPNNKVGQTVYLPDDKDTTMSLRPRNRTKPTATTSTTPLSTATSTGRNVIITSSGAGTSRRCRKRDYINWMVANGWDYFGSPFHLGKWRRASRCRCMMCEIEFAVGLTVRCR